VAFLREIRERGGHLTSSNTFVNRLKLCEGFPLVKRARRDGLLEETEANPYEYSYAFVDQNVAAVYNLIARVFSAVQLAIMEASACSRSLFKFRKRLDGSLDIRFQHNRHHREVELFLRKEFEREILNVQLDVMDAGCRIAHEGRLDEEVVAELCDTVVSRVEHIWRQLKTVMETSVMGMEKPELFRFSGGSAGESGMLLDKENGTVYELDTVSASIFDLIYEECPDGTTDGLIAGGPSTRDEAIRSIAEMADVCRFNSYELEALERMLAWLKGGAYAQKGDDQKDFRSQEALKAENQAEAGPLEGSAPDGPRGSEAAH
jgi:hypothetical protein